MNVWAGHIEQEFSTVDALKAHYKAVKSRLVSSQIRLRPKPKQPDAVRIPFSDVRDAILTLEDVQIAEARARKSISMGQICRAVEFATGVPVKEIRGPGRYRNQKLARFAFVFLCKKYTDKSLIRIGAFCGGRDHSTIHHAYHSVRKNPDTVLKTLEAVDRLISLGRNGNYVLTIPSETIRAEGVLSAPATALTK